MRVPILSRLVVTAVICFVVTKGANADPIVPPEEHCDRLNLRAFPSAQLRVIHSLGPHQCGIALFPYTAGNWQKIRAAGHYGWVTRKYLSGQ
jgi:hypothetical protein